MKIEQTNIFQSLIPGQPKRAENGKTDACFNDVLKRQIKETSEISANQPGRLQSAAGLAPAAPMEESTEPIQTAERLLDTVVQYSQLLNDPGTTMRNMEPTVRQMRMQVASLNRLVQHLPPVNPVKQVLEETRLLAAGEIERFDSGYYVDP